MTFCYNKLKKKENIFDMITELNLYTSLVLAAVTFGFAIRLGIALYKSN